jgi:hypothetical protein
MLRLIRDLLIPVVPLMTLARILLDEGIAVSLIGDWPELEIPPGQRERVRILAFQDPDPWREVAVLAHLSPLGIVSPLVWEAVAAGVAIVAPEHPSDAQFGALPSLLKPEVEYQRLRNPQWITGLKSLLKDGALRQKLAVAAQARRDALLAAELPAAGSLSV